MEERIDGVYLYVCMYVCVCVGLMVCIRMLACMLYAYLYIIHTYTHIHSFPRHMRVCYVAWRACYIKAVKIICIHTYMHVHTYTHTNSFPRHMRVCYVAWRACYMKAVKIICTCIHIHTSIHTYTQLSPTHAGMLCGMASLLHEGCEDLDGAVALLNRCLLKHPYHAGALFQVCALGYACVCVCVRILYL
jgi:hypothetical protein